MQTILEELDASPMRGEKVETRGLMPSDAAGALPFLAHLAGADFNGDGLVNLADAVDLAGG